MSRNKEKIQVFRCMEYSINLLKCKPNSSALTIIIILLTNSDKTLKNSMNFCKSNMRLKKKKLMIN
jgi:hypothetical protein